MIARFLSLAALFCAAAAGRADKLVLVAGGGTADTGKAAECQLIEPFGVDFDKHGAMYIVELSGGRVLRVDDQGTLRVFAGAAKQKGDAGDGGPAAKALFNGLHNLAIAPSGDIYLADTWNHKVRKIDGASGQVSTVAGTGQKGYHGDGGPAVKAQFGGIYCVALDPRAENLYLADLDNRRVRKINLDSGVVTTVAGTGKAGVPEDGAVAAESPLVDPRAVAVDARGNVYILERGGHALRVVDPAGKIKTVAGTGKPGNSGDGGDARKALLNGPKHLCIDRDGNVLIADAENHLVRKYLPGDGTIVRVAGTGKRGTGAVDGPPDKTELARPHGVYVHPSGTLYITDSYNHRILKLEK